MPAQTPAYNYSGSFTLGGNAATYYPVLFDDGGFDNNEATVLRIGRSIVHENGNWHGSIIAQFRYHTTNWGNASEFIDADIKQYAPSGSATVFVAGWADATQESGNKQIVIWLKGATTYHYYCNYAQNPIFTNGSVTAGGVTYNSKTQPDAYVNSHGQSLNGDLFVGGDIHLPFGSSFLAGDKNDKHLRMFCDGYDGYIDYSNCLYFRSSTGIKSAITNEGNFGIGAISPKTKFEVGDTIGLSVSAANIDPNQNYDLTFLKNTARLLLAWNRSGYKGEQNFISNRGSGSLGGFAFYDYTNNGIMTHLMTLSGTNASNPTVLLDVTGTIRAHEVKVCLNQGCDYVFDKDYNLMNINDLKNYVNTNKHLPDVAPAAEMEDEGINVSEMSTLLLKKVEELTLYIIELEKRISEMEAKKGGE
ncbi:hypothetical protein FACS1894180_3470 [Bacteroidia bacterium]|nr:hypothetical protein FACS1894180_3470 [Bacteroidia bacterium]